VKRVTTHEANNQVNPPLLYHRLQYRKKCKCQSCTLYYRICISFHTHTFFHFDIEGEPRPRHWWAVAEAACLNPITISLDEYLYCHGHSSLPLQHRLRTKSSIYEWCSSLLTPTVR